MDRPTGRTSSGHAPPTRRGCVQRGHDRDPARYPPAVVAVDSPTSGEVTDANPTITGVAADATSGVASLTAQVDSGNIVPVTFSASGAFQFATNLAPDGSADGAHVVHFRATDKAGNAPGPTDFPFTLMAGHGLLDGLNGVEVTQTGGSGSGQGRATADGFSVILREGNSFEVALKKSIIVPSIPVGPDLLVRQP